MQNRTGIVDLQHDFNMFVAKQWKIKISVPMSYISLGITESRPAGAFWADRIVFVSQKVVPQGPFGQTTRILRQKVVPQRSFGQTSSSAANPRSHAKF